MDRGSLIKAVIAASLNREFAPESAQDLTATTEKQRAAQMIVDAMLLGAPTTSACPTHINNNTHLSSSSLRASPTMPTWRSAANLLSLMKTGAPIRHHHQTSGGAFTVASSALREIHRALLEEPISKLRWQGALAASVASLQLHAGNDPSGSLRRAYRGAVVEAARDVGGQWTTVLSLLSGKQHQSLLLSGDTPSPSSSYLTPMLNGASIYKLKTLRNGIGKQWRDALQCGIILSNPSSSRQPTPLTRVTRVTQPSQRAAADAQRQDHHQDMLGGLRTSLASTPPPTPSAIAKALACLLAEQEAYRSTPSCPRSATVRAFSDDDEKALTTVLQRVALGLQQRHTKRTTKNDENTTFDLAVQQLATHLLIDDSLSSSAASFIASVVSPSVPPSAARSDGSTVVSSSCCWLRDDLHPLRLFMCEVWLQIAETQRTLPPLNSNRLLVQIVHALTAVDAAHDHDDILGSLYTRWVSCVDNYLQFHSSSRASGPHSLSYINKIGLLEGLLKCCNRTEASKGVAAETLASTCALTPAEFVAMPLACRLPFDTWVSWLAAHVKVLHHWTHQRTLSCVTTKAPSPPQEDEERVVERILSLLEYLMHAHPAQLLCCPRVADLIGTMTTKQFAYRPQQQLRWRGVLDSMAQLLLTLNKNNNSARHRHSSHQPRAVACAVFFQRGAMSAAVEHDWKMLNNLFHCAFSPLLLAAEVGGPLASTAKSNSREEYCSQKTLVNGALHCVLLLAVNKIVSHDRAEAGAALLRRTLVSTTNEQVVGSDSGTASCTMYRAEIALIHSLVALFDRHRHAVVRGVECSSSANDRSGTGVSRVILTSDDNEFISRASRACDAYLATNMRDHNIEGHDDTIPLLVRDVQSKLMIALRRMRGNSDGTTSRSSSCAWSDVMPCAYSFEERGGSLLGASTAKTQRHESLEHRPKIILEQDLLSSSFLTLSTSLAATRSNDHWRRR
ncbi:Hypothetical protein, putative [Bodo saltans]|uniref:Uncharacterized protein n=1 Tax=Bodo saltans TaxID=75058 RepID=A0A0S4IQI3_BODSA|nr:Hypothetical protein, putative [Bodo saltans]|eukprot:CUF18200.1 Hypothetical protein, putative [Bodo saltans]